MNNLKKLRIKLGYTCEQLGDCLKITRQAINYKENGVLTYKDAVRLSKVMNVHPFEILGTDILLALPKTEEEKEMLHRLIDSISIKENNE